VGKFSSLLSVVVLGGILAGCHSDGIDSFDAATTPVPRIGDAAWKGDKYAYAGAAGASGGTKPDTQYGDTARGTRGKLNPSFDQPAKGVGQQPGEYPVEANVGFGHSNAPANQPSPNQANDITTRGGQ
jgi:hypothetical protein